MPFWRKSVEQEVESELAFHIEMTARELVANGMSSSQARAEAERRFGDKTAFGAECRRYGNERDQKVRRAEYRDELRHDLIFGIRQLFRARGFAFVSILTLALGIGATAAVFSALDAVVLRPLPFENSNRIVIIEPKQRGKSGTTATPNEYFSFRRNRALSGVSAAVLGGGVTMLLGDVPETISNARVTADYFAAFSVKPEVGRTFSAAEDVPGGPSVVVISHRLWLSHFNGDRSVVGRTLQLDGIAHSIIGVMPASFDLTRDSEDMWLPLRLSIDDETNDGASYLQIFARIPANVTVEQARGAATVAERQAEEQRPHRTAPVTDFTAEVRRLSDVMVGDYRSLLFILLGAVGFVQLIACVNVANLLLARSTVRAKELAIRAALGAGRARLVRQLLAENLVLGVSGAVVGLVFAYALVRVIVGVSPANVPRLDQARIDWRVLAFTLSLGIVSCVLFGLFPALRTVGARLQGALRDGGRRSVGGRDRARAALVAIEVALAITLLVGSGLLIRSAWLVQHVDPGFDPHGVLAARLVLPEVRYPNGEAISRAYSQIRDDAARIPGVSSAALTSVVPMSGSSMHSSVRTEEQGNDVPPLSASVRLVSDGYFATMKIPVVAGRDVSRQDNASAPLVVVVNQALANALWPNVPAQRIIGKRIDALPSVKKGDRHLMEIVGVVGNLHEESLNESVAPEFYAPVAQTPEVLWPFIQRSLVVVLRAANSAVDAQALDRPLRRSILQVDASLPIAEAKTMETYLHESLATARMNTLLLSLLGAIALTLAMVGIYGVASYFVSQHTHEIGIRLALGASPRRIWQHVARVGLTPIAVGLAFGIGLSLLTTSVLRGQLYRVSVHDPATLGAVGIVLLLVGLVATFVPARRAMRVPPVVALNEM